MFIVGLFLLIFGLTWIYDIRPFLDENSTEISALDRVLEIGPQTGSIIVNIIGTVFVLASLFVFIRIVFPTNTEGLITDEKITCFENGKLKYEFFKNDIEWIDVWHGGKHVSGTVTIRALNGEETEIQKLYFMDCTKLKKCLVKYSYPQRDT